MYTRRPRDEYKQQNRKNIINKQHKAQLSLSVKLLCHIKQQFCLEDDKNFHA